MFNHFFVTYILYLDIFTIFSYPLNNIHTEGSVPLGKPEVTNSLKHVFHNFYKRGFALMSRFMFWLILCIYMSINILTVLHTLLVLRNINNSTIYIIFNIINIDLYERDLNFSEFKQ